MDRPVLPLLALAAILGIAPAAAPAPSLDGRIFLDSDILGVHVQRNPSAGSGPLSDSESHSIPASGDISASFEADYGLLRAQSHMQILQTGTLTTQSIDGGTTASAGWHDTLTISSPGLAGTQGTFLPVFTVHGSLSGSAAGSDPPFSSFSDVSTIASFLSSVIGVGRNQQRAITCHADAGDSICAMSGDSYGTWRLAPVPFEFGAPFTIDVTADAGVFLRTVQDGATEGTADFGSTVAWSGLAGVRDASAAPVASFTVSSSSGFNYAPEPGNLSLGAAAWGALSRLRTRRARARIEG